MTAWLDSQTILTESVTDQTIIAAPGEGLDIVVYGLHLSADIKQTVTLKFGSTVVWRTYLGADDPEDFVADHPIFRGGNNEALTITTDGAGDTFLGLNYQIQKLSRG